MPPGWKVRNQHRRRAVGVVHTRPMPDRRCQLNGSRRQGVCPLGAQVARTVGRCEKAPSSKNPSQALNRRAFLYLRPAHPGPVGDRLLIPFASPVRGLLPVPTEAAQDPPHVPRVITHVAELPNDRGHALQDPQVGGKTPARGGLRARPLPAAAGPQAPSGAYVRLAPAPFRPSRPCRRHARSQRCAVGRLTWSRRTISASGWPWAKSLAAS
jgi:hypothetical protein